MGNLLSFFRFGFYPIPHTIHSNNTKHTHAHTLTNSHTHTTINKAMPTLAALPAASLLSLAKRTTTITSSVGGVGGSNNFAVVHKKKFLFRCERVSVAVAVAVSDFASVLSCILYLLYFIIVDIMYYIFYTLQCYSSHTFINDFFTFLPQYKTPSPVAA